MDITHTKTGFEFSPHINYFTLTPKDPDQATTYSFKHKVRINGLIKPWLVIAILACITTSFLAMYGMPGVIFLSVRALLEIATVVMWWVI